jgi:hypothetical protein
MKRITTLQYPLTFHWVIRRTLLFELHYDELEHLSSQNHEYVDPIVYPFSVLLGNYKNTN